MKLLSVKKSSNKGKEFVAEFSDGKKVHFGTGSNFVLNPKKSVKDRQNYIKRHSMNPLEKDALKNYRSPARLSMDLLWGDSRNLETNIRAYKKKYRL
tara:strand:+ start:174 stop:464 length:291 start_codon:yes stop_codon:yes gene_type:complete